MTLSAQQLIHLTAPAIADQARIFVGPSYKALAAAGITLSLSGWTAPDTGKPSGWTEITDRTSHNSRLRYRLNGSSAAWDATLSGQDYDGALLGIGQSVIVWRRTWTPEPAAYAFGDELLCNGGFEEFTGTADDTSDDTFDCWTNYSAHPRANTDAHGGSYAVKIDGEWSGLAQQSISVTASTTYRLTWWSRGARYMAVGDDGSNIFENTIAAEGATWTAHTKDFATHSGITSMYIVFYPLDGADAWVYLDDVSLKQYGVPPTTGWQSWTREYVGQIVAADDGDDYRHGRPWQRTVRGMDSLVERFNAPRLTAGAIDITSGASVTVQNDDTLANTALEAGSGEFAGGLATLEPDYIVDGKAQTVWISQSTPGDNLLVNGSFEQYTGTVDDGVTDTLTGWTNTLSGTGSKAETVTAVKYHETAALKLTCAAGGTANVSQAVAVNAGQRYRVSVWAQGDGTVDGTVKVYGGSVSAPDLSSVVVDATTGHSSVAWGQYVVDFDAPTGKTHLWLYLGCTAEHYCYFDDAWLRDAGGESDLSVDGYARVSEVFFRPVAGVPLSQSWWVEVHSCRSRTPEQTFFLIAGSDYEYDEDPGNGNYTEFKIANGWKETLSDGRFAIVCANRAVFERITGGAPAAQHIIDASDYAPNFTLDPTDGFVGILGLDGRATVIWSPGGAVRHADYGGVGYWYGSDGVNATFDSDQTPEFSGYSIRKHLAVFTGDEPESWPPNFFLNRYPSPGAYSSNVGAVALKITLPENVCLLAQGTDGSTTTIQLDSYLGWLPAGKGLIEGGDVFSYTGRSATGLTGVTWDGGGTHEHIKDERVRPYAPIYLGGTDAYAEQTGYPVEFAKLFRRKTPYLERFSLYWSYMEDPRDYQASGWAADYSGHVTVGGVNQGEHALALYDAYHDTGYSWVRTFLLLIEHMTDSGRAKLNEFVAKINQIAAGDSGLPLTGSARSFDLASYLLQTYLGVHGGDLVDESLSNDHRLGTYALAVTSMYAVLDDLARKTGCLVVYGTDGVIRWGVDYWWPLKGTGAAALAQAITADAVRGELRWTDSPATIDAVILNAIVADSDEPRAVRAVYPPPMPPNTEPILGAQVEELNDIVVANESDVRLVAEREFKRLTTNGQLAATMTGVLAGVRPGDLLALPWDYDGSGSATRYWQIISIDGERGDSGERQTLRDAIEARLYL